MTYPGILSMFHSHRTFNLMLLGITFCLLAPNGYDQFLERRVSCGMKKGLKETRAVRGLKVRGHSGRN